MDPLDADEAAADAGADGATQDKGAVQTRDDSFAAAKEIVPAKAGEDTVRKDMNTPAAARGGGFGVQGRHHPSRCNGARPGLAVASQPVPTKAAAPKPTAAKPAQVRTGRRNPRRPGCGRFAPPGGNHRVLAVHDRVGAVFAAEEQGLMAMEDHQGPDADRPVALPRRAGAQPGAVEDAQAPQHGQASSPMRPTRWWSRCSQFEFVRPFNLAAMLEEAVAAGKIDLPALGAQPGEQWTSSFTYAVGGRPMGGMRAGIRRVATPVDATDALVVLIDSGSEPVSGSMRVVLRPDAASSARLVGYASNSATLIPGDTAEPGSLAVAVIELKSRARATPRWEGWRSNGPPPRANQVGKRCPSRNPD
ncbi:MAG: hypothetical protein U1F87_09415 [Kiritimatiellia bacterium]